MEALARATGLLPQASGNRTSQAVASGHARRLTDLAGSPEVRGTREAPSEVGIPAASAVILAAAILVVAADTSAVTAVAAISAAVDMAVAIIAKGEKRKTQAIAVRVFTFGLPVSS
jgi:hypothetical protein